MTRMRNRFLSIFLSLLVVFTTAGGSTVAKQELLVELFYSAAWHDVTDRVYTRDQITINHGSGNEQTGVVPSDASLTFTNIDGEMNPENRKSSLFGLIGHNTPIRITVDSDIRFSGQVVSWQPRRAIKGDAWVHIQAQGTIRRLGQGEPPVQSALYRYAVRDIDVAAYWPLEVSTGLSNVIVPSAPGTVTGAPLEFTIEGPPGSQKTPKFFIQDDREPVTQARFPIVTSTGDDWHVSLWFRALPGPDSGVFSTPVVDFAEIETQGSGIKYWMIEALSNPGASQFEVTAYAYDTNRGLITGPTIAPQVDTEIIDGEWHMIDLRVASPASNVQVTLTVDGDTSGSVSVISGSYVSGEPVAVYLPKRIDPANVVDLSMAHLGVWGEFGGGGTIETRWDVGHGYPAESAGDRFDRLCDEEDITGTIVGSAAETQPMGPQYPDTILNQLVEVARTDAGIIHDTRDQLGLTFRTGRSLYNQ